MKEFLAKGTALHGQGAVLRSRRVCWGWNMIATVGREEEEWAGSRCHGKGQPGSGGLAGCLNFTPHDWGANKAFKTAW